MKVISYIITLVWIIAGLYFGAAGWVGSKALQSTSVAKSAAESNKQFYYYDGITFADEDSLNEFLHERRSSRFFPWIFAIPQELTPLVASIGFGLLGGAVRLLKMTLDGASISPWQLFAEPLFGSIIGVMVFFLSFVLPAVFTSGKNPVRPEALVAFSLFGGIFSERAYNWIEGQIIRLFGKP